MTRDTSSFCLVGRLLYGAAWRGQLSHELNINPRTVARMAKGEHPIPPTLWDDLQKACYSRAFLLGSLAKRIAT